MRINFFLLFLLMLISMVNVQGQNRSGVYRYNKTEANGNERWGEVVIKEIRRKKTVIVSFTVSAEVYNDKCVPCWCNGEMRGTAKWTDPNVAEHTADLTERDPENGELAKCHLIFFFSGNRITIRSKDCLDYHGAACDFDGTYTRLRRSTKKERSSR